MRLWTVPRGGESALLRIIGRTTAPVAFLYEGAREGRANGRKSLDLSAAGT